MLEALVGTKTVQKILLFLFVNRKCYGTQLARVLKTSLTPIQKALLRLEEGGIIVSYYEGKTRVFQFNPAYCVQQELESLLKKAYTLLPTHEKKQFYVVNDDPSFIPEKPGARARIVLAFWEKLATVKNISFIARSKSGEEGGWNGKGTGEVLISKVGFNTLIFTEKGTWQGRQGEVGFSNVFRWVLDRNASLISLEHLRRGPENPVFLFHLAPTSENTLSSVDSHLCEGDTYFGKVHLDQKSLRLSWRVIGPKKNEELEYFYS